MPIWDIFNGGLPGQEEARRQQANRGGGSPPTQEGSTGGGPRGNLYDEYAMPTEGDPGGFFEGGQKPPTFYYTPGQRKYLPEIEALKDREIQFPTRGVSQLMIPGAASQTPLLQRMATENPNSPLRNVAGMTDLQRRAFGGDGSSLLSRLLSGNEEMGYDFQDPRSSPLWEGLRQEMALQEESDLAGLKREAQSAGMLRSGPAGAAEAVYRANAGARRGTLLGNLFEQERTRENAWREWERESPYRRLAAAGEYGGLERSILEDRNKAEYDKGVSDLAIKWDRQSPLLERLAGEERRIGKEKALAQWQAEEDLNQSVYNRQTQEATAPYQYQLPLLQYLADAGVLEPGQATPSGMDKFSSVASLILPFLQWGMPYGPGGAPSAPSDRSWLGGLFGGGGAAAGGYLSSLGN